MGERGGRGSGLQRGIVGPSAVRALVGEERRDGYVGVAPGFPAGERGGHVRGGWQETGPGWRDEEARVERHRRISLTRPDNLTPEETRLGQQAKWYSKGRPKGGGDTTEEMKS